MGLVVPMEAQVLGGEVEEGQRPGLVGAQAGRRLQVATRTGGAGRTTDE